jgi:hypothetical protein
MSDVELKQVVELALQLSDADQEILLARIAAHLAHRDEAAVEEQLDWAEEELAELLKPGVPKNGAEIAALIESGGLDTSAWSEMINPHITDAVEWVKALRRDAARRRNLDWGNE